MNTIQTNSNYVVFKKILSIHSEDRDIYQWADPNHFEITAPVEYKNVVSLRLNDIELPSSYYVFSNINQNTKLSFSILPSGTSSPYASILYGKVFTLMITSGTYNHDQLTIELAGTLNQLLSDYISSNTISIANNYNYFSVTYNPVTMKMMFLNKRDNFQFDFTKVESYNTCDTKLSIAYSVTCYDNYTNWGLGSYLGFDKKIYTSNPMNIICTTPVSYYVIQPENTLNLYGDTHIYMELMYYNSMDEVNPYAYKSHASNNAKFGGKHNSAFAKIPLFQPNSVSFSSRETYLSNIFFSDPPLERIQKFKVKFRHHDGRPVDFNNCNYTFTIEITMLKPDTIKPFIKVNSSNYCL
uniref:Uncharacterized protein n=1 Tax=viral metagenome TaxID=1070528 RepID=A0A6C0B835_9ZZZZ